MTTIILQSPESLFPMREQHHEASGIQKSVAAGKARASNDVFANPKVRKLVKPFWRGLKMRSLETHTKAEKLVAKQALAVFILGMGSVNPYDAFRAKKIKLGDEEFNVVCFTGDNTQGIRCCLWSGSEYPCASLNGFLGKGKFSTVQAVSDLVTSEIFALKIANPSAEAIQELQNECSILLKIEKLQANLRVKALPIASGGCFNRDSRLSSYASITTLYSRTCEDLYDKKMTEEGRGWLLSEFLQLLLTMENLRLHGLCVCDVKADNVFIDGKRLVFGDLGSSRDLKCIGSSDVVTAIGNFALGCTTNEDIQGLFDAYSTDHRHFFELLVKKDLFAFALLMCQVFGRGQKPFIRDSDGRYLVANNFDSGLYARLERILGENMMGLIFDMLEEEPSNRPSVKECIDRLESVIAEIESEPDYFAFSDEEDIRVNESQSGAEDDYGSIVNVCGHDQTVSEFSSGTDDPYQE